METKVTHTPGPWRTAGVNIGSANNRVVASCDADSPESVVVRPDSIEECAANARLIAAAPELLEACKAAAEVLATARRYFPKSIKNQDTFNLLNTEANSVKAAIAKATE